MDAAPAITVPSRAARRAGARWLYALALLPALLPLYLIYRYGVNFIWNDAWDMAAIFAHAAKGTLSFQDFWLPHNEHRIPVPYAIMFVLGRLTHWDTRAEMLFGWAVTITTSFSLAAIIRATASSRDESSPRAWAWKWLLVNLLLFSAVQYENWIYGFDAIPNFVPMACIVAAVVLLVRGQMSWIKLILAAVLAELAALSLANGLLGWFILFPLLLCKPRGFQLAWVVLAIIGIGTYFIGYQQSAFASRYYPADFITRAQFFLIFLGSPFTYGVVPPAGAATGAGLILAILYAAIVYHVGKRWRDREFAARALPWICIAGYSVGSAVLGAFGRAGMGEMQASTSRYTTASIYLPIALTQLLPMLFDNLRRRGRWRSLTPHQPAILSSLATLMLAGLLFSTIWAFHASEQWRRLREMGQAHLALIRFIDEPSRRPLVGEPDNLREIAITIDSMGYIHPPLIKDRDFTKILASSPHVDPGSCGATEELRTAGNTIFASGWALIPDPLRPASAVVIAYRADDGALVPCAIGDVAAERPDVAKALGPDLLVCGWSAEFPTSRLPANHHPLSCYAFDAQHQRAYPLPRAHP